MGGKQPRKLPRRDRLPVGPLGPGRNFDLAECGGKIGRRESVNAASIEDLPNVSQELHANRAIGGLRFGTERNERPSEDFWPISTGCVRDCEQGLGTILLPVGQFIRKLRPCVTQRGNNYATPRLDLRFQPCGFSLNVTVPESFDLIALRRAL